MAEKQGWRPILRKSRRRACNYHGKPGAPDCTAPPRYQIKWVEAKRASLLCAEHVLDVRAGVDLTVVERISDWPLCAADNGEPDVAAMIDAERFRDRDAE